ncbi:Hypothetical_protein [Hexamita inflata]|uniref:Hypothetical_protein n=1 Tax=Hexamita inflata TaxID=28002 RepID=A0AA86QAE5_9EUKA|nr:Hypothetical protein HINF_LOCUS43159 [Hexamita inflata]
MTQTELLKQLLQLQKLLRNQPETYPLINKFLEEARNDLRQCDTQILADLALLISNLQRTPQIQVINTLQNLYCDYLKLERFPQKYAIPMEHSMRNISMRSSMNMSNLHQNDNKSAVAEQLKNLQNKLQASRRQSQFELSSSQDEFKHIEEPLLSRNSPQINQLMDSQLQFQEQTQQELTNLQKLTQQHQFENQNLKQQNIEQQKENELLQKQLKTNQEQINELKQLINHQITQNGQQQTQLQTEIETLQKANKKINNNGKILQEWIEELQKEIKTVKNSNSVDNINNTNKNQEGQLEIQNQIKEQQEKIQKMALLVTEHEEEITNLQNMMMQLDEHLE